MKAKENEITELTIRQLLDGRDKYVIPIYQRNYAWEEKEIEQLIQDIIDYIPRNNEQTKNYYIGTLIINEVVENNEVLFETIDGQQRLTTLSILTSVIKNKFKTNEESLDWYKFVNLEFNNRINSTDTLKYIYLNYFPNQYEENDGIKNGYNLILKHLDKKLKEAGISIDIFVNYLFNYVKILRVQVPLDTDLNHYFEIMNTRGEQLEKHEVLKASLLSLYNEIKDDELKKLKFEIFNTIWEAVSDMDYYMQYRFEVNFRKALFGKDWNTLNVTTYDEVLEIFDKYEYPIEDNKSDIDTIISNEKIYNGDEFEREESDRFHSVINFSNFLLHVLRVQIKEKAVVLDDKKLLDIFKVQIDIAKESNSAVDFVDEFIFNLFKSRFLVDKFIIKREDLNGEDKWSLKTLKRYDGTQASFVNTYGTDSNYDNEIIIMLLSMFHVSTPTMIYKHWFNAVLNYLFNHYDSDSEIAIDEYIIYLERFAIDLVLHRFLNVHKEDYYDLIYFRDNLSLTDYKIEYDNLYLKYHNTENNLLFNFLDYIIWKEDEDGNFNDFHFTFRSSVEHFYPQKPIGGEPIEDIDQLHSFGNLCLISHSVNSKLSNHLPSAKKDYYKKSDSKLEYESLKQYIMMNDYDVENWDVSCIIDHNQKMIDIFNKFINDINNE